MKCRFCNAKITKRDAACPACSKANPQPQMPENYTAMKRTAIMYGCIAALAALAIALFVAMQAGWYLGSSFDWLKPRANDIYRKASYTVSDGKAGRKHDTVVAAMGSAQLTNGQLQIYYRMQVREFLLSYGEADNYLPLDYTKPLDQQQYDENTTWQQFFLESALQTWQTNQAFATYASENGYALPQAHQQHLDSLAQELQESATEAGYGDADEMLQAELGAGCMVADYVQYLTVYYQGYLYFTQLYESLAADEAEILSYFDENQVTFQSAGVTKTSGDYVDVRHILVLPAEDTDAAWAEAETRAKWILSQWEDSSMTEEYFISMVATYSEDESTAYTGGLYSDIVEGDMESAFDAWCFDGERKAGNYGLVKTSYGYHIVYFMDAEPIWHAEARTALVQARGQELVDAVLARYEMEVDYRKIMLSEISFG